MIKAQKVWRVTSSIKRAKGQAELLMPRTDGLRLRTTYHLKIDGSSAYRKVTVIDYVKNKFARIVSNDLRTIEHFDGGELVELSLTPNLTEGQK